MRPTYLNLHYHLILSTRHRELAPSLRGRVQEYLGGLVRGFGGRNHGVGGTGDEVHLLVSLRPTQCLAEFVREFKKSSAAWIRESCRVRGFAWRRGYSALTVDAAGSAAVHKYLATPKEPISGIS